MAEQPWLTATEAADYLGVSRRWLIRDSGIPRNQPPRSRKIRYRREVLEKTLRSWDTTDRQNEGQLLRRDANGRFRRETKRRKSA